MRLDGKVAIITGGNSGIGKATALLFAKEGAKVVITARREKQLQKVSEEILTMGGNVLAVASDISNPAELCTHIILFGAANEIRTRDFNLGKVALYR